MDEKYRFTVGTKVLCRTGADEWSAGTIVIVDYAEPEWTRTVPYQVELEDGSGLIYVPHDTVQLCRLLVPPWWKRIFADKSASDFNNNPPPDEIHAGLDASFCGYFEVCQNMSLENLKLAAKDFGCTDDDIKEAGSSDDARAAILDSIKMVNLNEKDHRGRSVLMFATQVNWLSGIEELLKMKADVNATTTIEKRHVLHDAVQHGEDALRMLVDAKADLNCQENDPDFDPEFTSKTFGNRVEHRTPLHIAALMGYAPAASVLLTAGATIDIPDAQYRTALHCAIDENHPNVIDLLLRHGADANLTNQSSGMKNTALMDVAHRGDLEITKLLLLARAAINKQGKQDMSALHFAVRKGHTEIVQALLDSRADMHQESKCGTVAQLAHKNGSDEMLRILGLTDVAKSSEDAAPSAKLTAAQRAALYMD